MDESKVKFDYSKLTDDELRYIFYLEVGLKNARRSIELLTGEYVVHVHDNMFRMLKQLSTINQLNLEIDLRKEEYYGKR